MPLGLMLGGDMLLDDDLRRHAAWLDAGRRHAAGRRLGGDMLLDDDLVPGGDMPLGLMLGGDMLLDDDLAATCCWTRTWCWAGTWCWASAG
ncbi:hypothetical protein PF010_g27730, partial [Phytophthora fragariae]